MVGQAELPDGLYHLKLDSVVVLPDGTAFERYALTEAPGFIYEECHALDSDE